MKILMIAPEPIFEPRGTPLSVVGRLKAFSDMGHRVDLLTYPIGRDVKLPGLRIYRIHRIPGIGKIKIGPSLKKIPLDFCLIIKTVVCLSRNHYDLIHTHEEAGFWGMVISRIFKKPHLYDMHSSLPQQLSNFQFTRSKIVIRVFEMLEKNVLKYADCVLTICPDLYRYVKKRFSYKYLILIENIIDYGMIFGEKDISTQISQDLNLQGKKVILYTGTFEPYQGLDLMIESVESVIQKVKSAVFLFVGGHPEQIAHYQNIVKIKSQIEDAIFFTGQVPPEEVNSYIRCADVLVSPRIAGTNTPLKIYSYLRSGVPIVATRLRTHTQVLNDQVAVLVDPTPEQLAAGIISAATDKKQAKRLGKRSAQWVKENYSYRAYVEKMNMALHRVMVRMA
ncbi:glycosyltransferase family 4 protein [bacterium]|nr:glycosyltransferase family 4 protein [bacterium]